MKSEKKSIHVLVISNLYPNDIFPALGVFVNEQVKSLLKLNVKITVVAPVPLALFPLNYLSGKWKKYSEVSSEEIRDGIKIYRPKFLAIPGGLLKHYWFLPLYLFSRKLILRLHKKNEFDLIHVHGSAPDDYLGYLISKKINVPYILNIHGETIYKLTKVSRFKSSKTALENADAVITVSSVIKKRIQRYTNLKNEIYTILNGYTPIEIPVSDIEKNDQAIVVVFAGYLIERKGCEYLIRAFRKLKDKYNNISLNIIGDGMEKENLRKLTFELSLSEDVNFLGELKHSDVLTTMNKADIFVLPSWDEAFGVVYLEAMSLKLPVIGSKNEGIADVIEDGKNGLLVEIKNVDSIFDKLEMLIKDKEFRRTIGLDGYNTIKKYTWDYNAENALNVYHDTIKKYIQK